MDDYGLEQDLKKLFVTYGPLRVMMGWKKILAEFRQALMNYEQEPPKITLKDVIEPVKENIVEFPKKVLTQEVPDKDAQKEKLKVHKEAIAKKRQELAGQGIIPETLLTEENLKKWIQVEKKNYWQIAELTGCADTDISAKAKSLNILSEFAMYIRNKRRTQK